ncbi:aliphatic sulfonate ABC transporter substrate-binding protein [Micromonospora sp. NBC_01796]|uniref:aliphatic sulfonate ABC transporter substrate-binding protein n=1 Tax=Micromonospora sp. NBC_01796 TaxID=2975987 RepID=UPI002DDBC68A|nr:aliphatic sulfonate ABC transporter substrate-binding protein [Micromonospora sp. NBC_01796]WSA84651.1 aliphatic sulfonate ABC transporter substrate-binding protein [Micromonospora sp. NBC_01796]
MRKVTGVPVRVALAMTAVVALLTGCVAGEDSGSDTPDGTGVALRLDYAYWNPESLVLRDQKWLETELADKRVSVTWQLSAGSNKANENLRAAVIDIGSTAGVAALVARANGSPIKTVEVFSQPEWAAIVVAKNSPIASVAQLKGRKIAATKGTDPYFFLLQALDQAGLKPSDVTVVNLQHADGKTALERGDVDAWAGLDPHMAQSQVDAGSKLIYRNLDFNTYGVLNAREDFIAAHPELVQAVVNAYERARAWLTEHPDQAVELLARESKVSAEVARVVLAERTRLAVDPVPGAAQRQVFERVLPILVADGNVRSADEARTALDSLLEPRFAQDRAKP